jgi:hypothetical protein
MSWETTGGVALAKALNEVGARRQRMSSHSQFQKKCGCKTPLFGGECSSFATSVAVCDSREGAVDSAPPPRGPARCRSLVI